MCYYDKQLPVQNRYHQLPIQNILTKCQICNLSVKDGGRILAHYFSMKEIALQTAVLCIMFSDKDKKPVHFWFHPGDLL